MKIAFIGLGTMGYPMAGHLQKASHEVCVYNRTAEKALQWKNEYGGEVADTAKKACLEAELVLICVGNDNDLREICYSDDGVLAGLTSGAILVDHTTTSADVAKEISLACLKQNNTFLDAPVSGGQVGAENGLLTIMLGGDEKTFGTIQSTLDVYAKQMVLMGDVGAGQTTKMVNQLCIAGILQGMSEGLSLAAKSGLDLNQVCDVLKHGAAQSWQLEQRTETIAKDEFDFGFAIDWMRKDLGICLDRADSLSLNLPMAKHVDEAYGKLQELGRGRQDTSVLIKAIELE